MESEEKKMMFLITDEKERNLVLNDAKWQPFTNNGFRVEITNYNSSDYLRPRREKTEYECWKKQGGDDSQNPHANSSDIYLPEEARKEQELERFLKHFNLNKDKDNDKVLSIKFDDVLVKIETLIVRTHPGTGIPFYAARKTKKSLCEED